MKATYEKLIGPAVLLLIVILFYWKLVLTNQYTWLESPDLSTMVLPWMQFQASEWHHGHFPMWDPNSWFGLPLFGQGEPGSAYPLNWLLFLVPLKHGWIRESALNWYFVLTRYLAALTSYALARDLGRSRAASILAGCVYALGGYVADVTWPQHVNGAVWTPLVFLFLLRAARGERPFASAVSSGFFLGFGWLAGHHQMNLLASLAAAGLWIWLCVRDGKLNLRMARLAACSFVVAILASAFQTLPLAEYGRVAVRWAGAATPLHLDETVPYNIHEEYALKPVTLLGIFIPNIQAGFSAFIGIVAFSVGILGAILAWRERQVRWLTALSLGGILYSLGPNSVFHGVLYSLVPLVEKARVPVTGILIFAVGFAPLVAYGVDLLPEPQSFEWSRRAGLVLLCLTAVLALASLVFWAVKVPGVDDRIMITALCAILLAALLSGWRAGTISIRAGACACIGLVLFELANVTNHNLPNRYLPEAFNSYLHHLAEHGDLAAYIRNQGIAARVDYDTKDIPYNVGDWYGLETSHSNGASILDDVWHMDMYSPRGQNFFGIRYYLGKTAPRPELKEVFQGRSGVKVFENIAAFPRVWSVHEATSLPDKKLITQAMAEAHFDALHTVLLAGEALDVSACPGAQRDEVEMPLHASNQVRIQANLQCRGMVILSDGWFPGWRATVDGKPSRIYEVYGGVRGVVVEGGQHLIEMKYRPRSVMLGGLMTALAAIFTAWVAIASQRAPA